MAQVFRALWWLLGLRSCLSSEGLSDELALVQAAAQVHREASADPFAAMQAAAKRQEEHRLKEEAQQEKEKLIQQEQTGLDFESAIVGASEEKLQSLSQQLLAKARNITYQEWISLGHEREQYLKRQFANREVVKEKIKNAWCFNPINFQMHIQSGRYVPPDECAWKNTAFHYCMTLKKAVPALVDIDLLKPAMIGALAALNTTSTSLEEGNGTVHGFSFAYRQPEIANSETGAVKELAEEVFKSMYFPRKLDQTCKYMNHTECWKDARDGILCQVLAISVLDFVDAGRLMDRMIYLFDDWSGENVFMPPTTPPPPRNEFEDLGFEVVTTSSPPEQWQQGWEPEQHQWDNQYDGSW